MRATMIYGPNDVRLTEVPDAKIVAPTDAVVTVSAACVCGSDLWSYRGISKVDEPKRIGHEFIGVVAEVGTAVTSVKPGDFVISPFTYSDGTCFHCKNGVHTSCVNGGFFSGDTDGGQGEAVRVPFADGTLKVVPGGFDQALIPSLLTLSDVFPTGHHAAVSGGVRAGSTVVVVGDGAVGLSAVLAAHRLGAARIIAMSRHADRQKLALTFGATDVVAERGEEGVEKVKDLLGGFGADSALECVGTDVSMEQAIASVRPGGTVGYVGVPAGGSNLPIGKLFSNNIHVAGGVAPVRNYLDELLPEVLAGTVNPGLVFDLSLPLSEISEAYAAMDERRAIKTLVTP
jgi:threonine dehydrogenase-like Zn-dependent dehydrogenase